MRNGVVVDEFPAVAQRFERHPDVVENLEVVQATDLVPGLSREPVAGRVRVRVVQTDACNTVKVQCKNKFRASITAVVGFIAISLL